MNFNINDYIEKHSTVEVGAKLVTVTMTVPYIAKDAPFDNREPRITIYCDDVERYLEHKKITISHIVQNASVVNSHPAGLTGTWIFRHSMKVQTKRKRSGVGMKNKTKTTNKEV